MKIFQVWTDFGDSISDRCVHAMCKNMSMSSHYTLISDENFLGVDDFRLYSDIEKEALEDVRVRDMLQNKNKWLSTEVIRAWFLWKNPDYIYLDADLILLKPLNSNPEKPAFARYDNGIDVFLIQGNGHGEYFNQLLTKSHDKNPNQCFPMISCLFHNWDNVIEPEYFNHFNQNKMNDDDINAVAMQNIKNVNILENHSYKLSPDDLLSIKFQVNNTYDNFLINI